MVTRHNMVGFWCKYSRSHTCSCSKCRNPDINANGLCNAMPVVIQCWYGRLGNNIVQVYHGLMEAIERKTWLIIPQSDIWRSTRIDIPNCVSADVYIAPDDYHLLRPVRDLRMHSDLARELLRRSFVVDVGSVPALGEGSTVVHIRSGDIFRTFSNHASAYVPPPLAYYAQILRERGGDTIVIAEDAMNPVVGCIAVCGGVRVCIGRPLLQDIVTMLGAETLVMSVGTFVPALAFLSINCKRVVCPDYIATDHRLGGAPQIIENVVALETIDVPGYVDSMYPWSCTPEQLRNVLTYRKE